VVEIAAVDVGYRFHSFPIKKIGPQTLRPKTLFRVGRTLRLDMNLWRGSRIVYQIRRRIQGGNMASKGRKASKGFTFSCKARPQQIRA
jgi:hypothetical protein